MQKPSEAEGRKTRQKDYEELQAARITRKQTVTAEFQVEVENSSHSELHPKRTAEGNEAGILTVRQEADELRRELEREIKPRVDGITRYTAEQEMLFSARGGRADNSAQPRVLHEAQDRAQERERTMSFCEKYAGQQENEPEHKPADEKETSKQQESLP